MDGHSHPLVCLCRDCFAISDEQEELEPCTAESRFIRDLTSNAVFALLITELADCDRNYARIH